MSSRKKWIDLPYELRERLRARRARNRAQAKCRTAMMRAARKEAGQKLDRKKPTPKPMSIGVRSYKTDSATDLMRRGLQMEEIERQVENGRGVDDDD